MPAIPFLGGTFHSLAAGDVGELFEHWRRLPPESLKRRFLRAMSAEALAAQARAALSPPAETIGWYGDGMLRGVAELHPQGDMAEAAFTVEPGWRKRGIGRELYAHAVRRARNRGLSRLVIMTTADNFPMMRIATGAGATLEREGGEVIGTLALAPATPASVILDMGEETAGQIAAFAGSLERMAGAWLWDRRRPAPVAVRGSPPPPAAAEGKPTLDIPPGTG